GRVRRVCRAGVAGGGRGRLRGSAGAAAARRRPPARGGRRRRRVPDLPRGARPEDDDAARDAPGHVLGVLPPREDRAGPDPYEDREGTEQREDARGVGARGLAGRTAGHASNPSASRTWFRLNRIVPRSTSGTPSIPLGSTTTSAPSKVSVTVRVHGSSPQLASSAGVRFAGASGTVTVSPKITGGTGVPDGGVIA